MEIDRISDQLIETCNSTLLQDNFYTPSNQEFYSSDPYSDLDVSKHEIRLLELLPVNPDEPLRAKLITPCFLSSDAVSPPSYCAISYFAGNHKDTEVIFVNEIRFNAFANLARALRQIVQGRGTSGLQVCPQHIWVDQICINQSNPAERSHQVGFMRKIYENAQVVLACLGEDPSNGRWVEAAKRLNFKVTSISNLDLKDRTVYVGDRIIADFYNEEIQRDWASLGDLLGSTWWRRGWVYQEVLLARNIIVFFGHGILDWKMLLTAVLVVYNVSMEFISQRLYGQNHLHNDESDAIMLPKLNSTYAKFMVDGRGDWTKTQEIGILALFFHAQECDVTDPRDRVFAFVGLADPGYEIVPDYGIDTSAVIQLACKRIILYESSLNFLACCDIGSDPNMRRADIPSWTPDWSSGGTPSIFIYDAGNDSPSFRASSEYPSAAAFHSHKDKNDSVLRVQGLFIDHLATISSILSDTRDLKVWETIAGFRHGDEYPGLRTPYNFDQSITIFDAFYEVVLRGKEIPEDEDHKITVMADLMAESREGGQFLRSSKGYLGLASLETNLLCTDMIWVLLGANIPFILRKVNDHFLLVGMAYVEGLMYGEAIEMMKRGELVVETIDIH